MNFLLATYEPSLRSHVLPLDHAVVFFRVLVGAVGACCLLPLCHALSVSCRSRSSFFSLGCGNASALLWRLPLVCMVVHFPRVFCFLQAVCFFRAVPLTASFRLNIRLSATVSPRGRLISPSHAAFLSSTSVRFYRAAATRSPTSSGLHVCRPCTAVCDLCWRRLLSVYPFSLLSLFLPGLSLICFYRGRIILFLFVVLG